MATEFKIVSNIPLPTKRGRFRYPLDDMKVGNSFRVDANDVQGLRMAISQRKRRGREERFTVRKNGDSHRCWRIE